MRKCTELIMKIVSIPYRYGITAQKFSLKNAEQVRFQFLIGTVLQKKYFRKGGCEL